MLHRSRDVARFSRDQRDPWLRIHEHAGLYSVRPVPDVMSDVRAVASGSGGPARARRHGARAGRGSPRGHTGSSRARAELPGVRRVLGGVPGRGAHGSTASGPPLDSFERRSWRLARAPGEEARVRLAVHGLASLSTPRAPAWVLSDLP